MKEELTVKRAECCRNCKNTFTDFTFRDAVLCGKTNEYRSHTEVCEEMFEMKEQEEE